MSSKKDRVCVKRREDDETVEKEAVDNKFSVNIKTFMKWVKKYNKSVLIGLHEKKLLKKFITKYLIN